jgi:PKD repeat protein
VTFSASGINAAKNSMVTFSQAGSYTFTATITDQGGLSVNSTTATVTVAQTPTGLALTPATATVASRATQQFTATVTDQFGKAISNPAVIWA